MRLGEVVSQCSVCGLDFYESEMVRHYKTGRLVDALCADEPSGSDYLEKMDRPVEKRIAPRQPVPSSEDGYNPADWAEAIIAGSFGVAIEVLGNNRDGIITITGGTADNVAVIFNVFFGTSLVVAPTSLTITSYNPAAEGKAVSGSADETHIGGGVFDIKAHVVYQWRYEVR